MADPQDDDIFQIDQVLNNTYKIETILGRGGTGEVYRAKHLINGRVMAIKVLNAQFSANADYVELMKREEEMRDIVNEAVVRYWECSRTDGGHVYLVMDFVDGPSLNDEMFKRAMKPKELMIVAHRVATGLIATHAAGIVHRDLSPDNIILRGGTAEAATIIDFGIAKDMSVGARTIVGNEFAGKYEYAAPEQLDGHAEPRSDFFALGATLLAAFHGEVPFLGATPGEIVRRKQSALDTETVPKPLRELIDWLVKPEIAERPKNASEIVAWIDDKLKTTPSKTRSRNPKPTRKKRRSKVWFLLPALALGGVAGAYALGYFDRYFVPPLPVADPYALRAAFDQEGTALLEYNAPDAVNGDLLDSAFSQATAQAEVVPLRKLATGLPDPNWVEDAASLLGVLTGVPRWSLNLEGTHVRLDALAKSVAARAELEAGLFAWSDAAEMTFNSEISAGPEFLPSDEIQTLLDSAADCGPLQQRRSAGEEYALLDPIEITGDVASSEVANLIRDMATPRVGDRKLGIDLNVLNSDLCKILNVLPPFPSNNVSIWLGNGRDNSANLSGIYRVNENPVAEVHMPANINQGSLWVMIVDNTGKVFHVLPHINRPDHNVATIGSLTAGVRQVRVLYSIDEFLADNNRSAMRITDGDFGKSQIIAILSKSNLFDIRRPREESIDSVAEALSVALSERGGEIIGVATRIIDARQ